MGSTNPTNNTVAANSTNSSSTRKGCLWTLSPAKATKMDEEVLKWSRKDPAAIKRAMAYPGKQRKEIKTIDSAFLIHFSKSFRCPRVA